MIRFSLPPAFVVQHTRHRTPQPVTVNVQRACAHYERIVLFAVPGMWHELKAEQGKLCAECQETHLSIAQLAFAPRLRLHSEHGVWAVERLLSNGRTLAFHVVAWLQSQAECEEWIRNTYAGRPYEMIEGIAA